MSPVAQPITALVWQSMTVARYSQPCHVGMYVMSPTSFSPGRASGEIPLHAVGDAVLLAVALGEAEPPRPRLAGLQAQLAHHRAHELRAGLYTPQAARSAWTRRYPYVPSDSSNDFCTARAIIPRLFAVADSGLSRHS